MNTKSNPRIAKTETSMSKETKENINKVSKILEGKTIFPDKIERAKKLIQALNSYNNVNRLAL